MRNACTVEKVLSCVVAKKRNKLCSNDAFNLDMMFEMCSMNACHLEKSCPSLLVKAPFLYLIWLG